MARISTYGVSSPAELTDELLGSDIAKATKNFTIGSIIDLTGIPVGIDNTLSMFGPDSTLIGSIVTQTTGGSIDVGIVPSKGGGTPGDPYFIDKFQVQGTMSVSGKVAIGTPRELENQQFDLNILGNEGKIAFGDNNVFGDLVSGIVTWNVVVGEYGTGDTDVLQLHGKAGTRFTRGPLGTSPTMTILSNGNVEIDNNLAVIGSATFGEDDGNTVTMEATLDMQGPVKDASGNLGTVGQVLVSTGGGSLAWGTAPANIPAPLYINETTQRVGIRTAFPQVAFHVDGAIRVRGDLQVSQQNNNTFVGENMPDLTVITGSNNTALGDSVMPGATSASSNTGLGALSLNAFETGNNNTAVGADSMKLSNGASNNTAIGEESLNSQTIGNGNTAIGRGALRDKSTSNFNTAVGHESLSKISTAFRNTAVGNEAGKFTSDGTTANSTGNNSVFIGDSTKSSAIGQNNQIVIGQGAVGNGANTATIGNTATTALHVGGNNAGIVLKSPDGTAYKITVSNAGALIVS